MEVIVKLSAAAFPVNVISLFSRTAVLTLPDFSNSVCINPNISSSVGNTGGKGSRSFNGIVAFTNNVPFYWSTTY